MWHNIAKILRQTSVVLPGAERATAAELSDLQTESRYPDYTTSLFEDLTPTEAHALWHRTVTLRQFLLDRL